MDKTIAVRQAFEMRRYKARMLRNELAQRERIERTVDQMLDYAASTAALDRKYDEGDQLERLQRQVAVLAAALEFSLCWKTTVADLISTGPEAWRCDGWNGPLPW